MQLSVIRVIYHFPPSEDEMALETQSTPGLLLPQGWSESEQAMINHFFEQTVPKVAQTTCTASECVVFAQSLMPGKKIFLVNNQGAHSFTLACEQSSQIVQFRLKELRIDHIEEAKEMYGELISRAIYHSGFKLPVYPINAERQQIYDATQIPL